VQRDVDPDNAEREPSDAGATPVASGVAHPGRGISVEGQPIELDEDHLLVESRVVDARDGGPLKSRNR
jgi:hypothetical protein